MADSDKGERTEDATGKRRADYREKGQVAQSKEVTTAALMTFSLLLWVFYARYFWADLNDLMATLLRMIGNFRATPLSLINLLWEMAGVFGRLLWPIFSLSILVGFFEGLRSVAGRDQNFLRYIGSD